MARPKSPFTLLQIWIEPERAGLPPGYEQSMFSDAMRRGRLCLVGSRDGRGGSLTIHQDVAVYIAALGGGQSVSHALAPGRRAWIQVMRGRVEIDGTAAEAGDGVAVVDQEQMTIRAGEGASDEAGDEAEILLFDLR